MKETRTFKKRKTLLVVGLMIAIALLHFITGSHYKGPFPLFVNGYLIDIVLPFGLYFLLYLIDSILLESWIVKGSLIFLAAFLVEMVQYKGFYLFGRTFDPLDIMAYGLGVSLAVICDQLIFPRLFVFWTADSNRNQTDVEAEEGMFSWRNH